MGHDVAVHFARFQQRQVNRIVGNWSQARVEAVLKSNMGALLEKRLAALDGPPPKQRSEHLRRTLGVIPDVREIATGIAEALDDGLKVLARQFRSPAAQRAGLSLRHRAAELARKGDQAQAALADAKALLW